MLAGFGSFVASQFERSAQNAVKSAPICSLKKSDGGSDVRDLRVGRPRRSGLLEREAALLQIRLDVLDADEFRDDVRQIRSGGASQRRRRSSTV